MHAADTREQSAAIASFQRFQPSHSPVKIVNSAALKERFASHFGGSNAKNTKFANQVHQIPVVKEYSIDRARGHITLYPLETLNGGRK